MKILNLRSVNPTLYPAELSCASDRRRDMRTIGWRRNRGRGKKTSGNLTFSEVRKTTKKPIIVKRENEIENKKKVERHEKH